MAGSGRRLARRRRDMIDGYLFLLPFLATYLLLLIYPFFKGVWISLHEWNLLAVTFNPSAKEFIGIANYITMLWGQDLTWSLSTNSGARLALLVAIFFVWLMVRAGSVSQRAAIWCTLGGLAVIILLGITPAEEGRWSDTRFWQVVGNTVLFVLITVPGITIISLALAIALNRQSPIMATFRTLFFLSQVLSVTVVTLIWQIMFSSRQGLLANALSSLGLPRLEWLTDPQLAMAAIVIATIWWSIGFAIVIFLAGLQDIPSERYEAARVDGASTWGMIWHIILPGIRRTISLVMVLQIVLHFQVFGQAHLMTGGGPNDSTQVLVRYIYQTAFRDSELGYASALAVVLFVLMLGFSIIQFRLNQAEED